MVGLIRDVEEGDENEGSWSDMSKVKWCLVYRVWSEDSGKHPCGVCRKGVGRISIMCRVF